MKRTILIILAVVLVISRSVAQGPTLTAGGITPSIGEGFVIQFASTTGVDAKSGGASQTWDYSGIVDSAGITGYVAVAPASTPYFDSFPTSNLAVKSANDSAFLYFNSQADKLWEIGLAASDTEVIRYTTPKIYLPYPFSYQSFFTDSVVLESPRYKFSLRGKDSLTGDGYGTLKIPGKVFSNVLRVKYIENQSYVQDTIFDFGQGSVNGTFKINLRTINYIYYTPDTHAPLFSNVYSTIITSISVAGLPLFADTSSTQDVSYLKAFTLPVTFASFDASLHNNDVALQWQTGEEINAGHFNVQRSLTGNQFTDIAQVAASGNSTGSHYAYTDQDYAKTGVPPTVYYRIKETDKDGKQFFSKTNVIHGNSGTISIYPNPVKSYISLNIKNATTADAITLYDAKGHAVKQFTNYQLSKPINVANLSKGTYFIQIKINGNTSKATIIKE